MAEIIDFTVDPAENTARLVRDGATGCFQQMRAAFINCDMLVWQNPHQLTPAQAFAALGTRAAKAVEFMTKVAQTINQMAPPEQDVASLKPAGVVITSNPDGTVTLS